MKRPYWPLLAMFIPATSYWPLLAMFIPATSYWPLLAMFIPATSEIEEIHGPSLTHFAKKLH